MILVALLATAVVADAPICPDRPGKGNGTCTVPEGHFQLETGLVDWTRDTSEGNRSDLILWGSSFVKYGLGDSSDVELGFTPLETLRVSGGGEHDSARGFGDVVLRFKHRLTSEASSVQAAVIPFVKLPTASRALGNGKFEGGLAVPLNAALGSSGVTLTLGPELDLRPDGDGHGYHVAMAQVATFGLPVSSRLSLSAELWSGRDWDPAATTSQVSADASAAYLVADDLQVDTGANFGLNRETPDVEFYAGVSKRF